jgi:hypothetical protein
LTQSLPHSLPHTPEETCPSGASDVVAPNRQGSRDRHGRFAKGNHIGPRFEPSNVAAVSHGLHARDLPPELAGLRDEVAAFLTGALVDEGDADDVPARRRALLEYRARLHRRILQLDSALEVRGLVDRRGKLRVAWLQQLAGLIERARGLDVTLGLARRQKRVPTLADVLADDVDDAS